MGHFLKFTIYMCVLTIFTSIFIKCVFVVGKRINTYDTFKENEIYQRKHSEIYQQKLYNLGKSQVGKNIMNNLDILAKSFHEINTKGKEDSKSNLKEKEHYREALQYIEFTNKKSGIKKLIKEIKEALKVIFMEETATIQEKEEIEDMKRDIEKNKKKEKIEPLNAEEEEENMFLEDKDEVKNAIILDNLINIFKSLKTTLPENEYKKIMNDKRLLFENVLRPDLALDNNEFNKYFTGISSEEIKSSTTLPSINFDEVREVDDKSPNYCSINDTECDRRQFPDSCESRMPINNQGICKSSWAFAALQSIEFSHCLASGKNTKYSRQEILDCSTRECNGGFTGTVSNYLLQQQRVAADSEYPYEATKVSCRSNSKSNVWTGEILKQDTNEMEFIINRDSTVTDDQWNNFIKKFIIKHGAIVAYLVGDSLRFEQNPILYLCENDSSRNHAVLITGWKVVNGVPVWIMRNSWGAWWGMNGYKYISIQNNCPAGFYPLAVLHIVNLGKWSDEISPYKAISEEKNKNTKELTLTLDIGEEKSISCDDEKLLHIIKYYVYASDSVSEEKLCDQLDLKNKCENKSDCDIYFPQHTCGIGYDTLKVEHECLPGLSLYNCKLAKSIDNDVSDIECISLCRVVVSKCRPVTKECLDATANVAYCNFDKVPKPRKSETEENPKEMKDALYQRRRKFNKIRLEEKKITTDKKVKFFDCAKALAKSDSTKAEKCVEVCELHAEECSTIECLHKKISTDTCDFSNILVNELDCTNAVATPNEAVSKLCVQHCEFHARNCNTFECISNEIPDYACDLSQII